MPEEKGTVLYVGGFELPDKNAAAHRVLSNAKIFRDLGYRVIFCGVDRENTTDEAVWVSGFESMPLKYPASVKQWIKHMLDAKKYLQILSENKDIKLVVCYNLLAIPMAKLLRYCKKRNIKIVADCTEWYANGFSLHPERLIKFLNTLLCMRWFQKRCDGMIAISSFLENYYKKHIRNIIVVPPLVDIEDEKFSSGEKKKDGGISLVYSGSPALRKEALGEVVSALNRMGDIDFSFTVVGITREQFCGIYDVEPDDSRIVFTGRIGHREALKKVRESDYAVIIRPETRITAAGFPTKFVEAVSCNTAVIANDTSDIAQYLKEGKNGHLVGLDSLEDGLRTALTSEMPYIERERFDYRLWRQSFSDFLVSIGL